MAIPSTDDGTENFEEDVAGDSQMSEPDGSNRPQGSSSVPTAVSSNADPEEARLEARELSKYLLAKSYFDCKEYDRCAAVFLPENLPSTPVAISPVSTVASSTSGGRKGKGKASLSSPPGKANTAVRGPRFSQKALFLSLYAKFLAGEKRKDEESEMILGPADGGATINKELNGLSQRLEGWCTERMSQDGTRSGSQGWLEFL